MFLRVASVIFVIDTLRYSKILHPWSAIFIVSSCKLLQQKLIDFVRGGNEPQIITGKKCKH
jgi:hypothetical protein